MAENRLDPARDIHRGGEEGKRRLARLLLVFCPRFHHGKSQIFAVDEKRVFATVRHFSVILKWPGGAYRRDVKFSIFDDFHYSIN